MNIYEIFDNLRYHHTRGIREHCQACLSTAEPQPRINEVNTKRSNNQSPINV